MPYSRFYLTDLQVHTPADSQHKYGDWGGATPNPAFAKRFIEVCVERGLRVLAVTDHNRVDWYPVLRDEGERHGVYVFPGTEVSINRCHLLIVWDRSDAAYALAEQFLASCWDPGAVRFKPNGDPLPVSKGQVADVAERAVAHRGLVLAPHSTQKDIGFFAGGVCTNRADVIKKNVIAGYDVYGNPGLGVLKSPNAEFSQLPVAWFISGDVRSFDEIGKRASFMKLGAKPSLEGLRQAFLMPETRIRLPDSLRATWGHVVGLQFIATHSPTWPRLTHLKIDGGFHDSLSFDIGPGLNAIIGGKGTGKSALIEIVRHAMEAGTPTNPDLIQNRKANFRPNAEAQITFLDGQGQEYTATRAGTDTPAKLLSAGKDTGVAVNRRFKLTVFGQRELQALADGKADGQSILRQFVASTSADEWERASADEKAVRQGLEDANSRIGVLETTLQRLEEKEADLADHREKLDQARKGGADALLKETEALTSQDALIQAALQWPDAVEKSRTLLAANLPPPQVPTAESVPSTIAKALSTLATSVKAASSDVETEVRTARAALAPAVAEWNEHVKKTSDGLTAALAALGIGDAAELTRIQNRVAMLEAELATLASSKSAYSACEAERADLLTRLNEVARRKSRIVEDAALALNKRLDGRVRLNVEPLADSEGVVSWLKQQTQGASIPIAQLQKLAAHPTGAIANAARTGASNLVALGCTTSSATKLLERLSPRGLRELEELQPPDLITAEVNLSQGTDAQWKPVNAVSPGQRATALLALVLLSSNEPLLIDQPEDDLDNQHIYEDTVKVLADVCQHRQVIVATHNANIPVLGDAELLIALDADAQRSRVEAIGGFENEDVATYARRILEGGEDAFRARQRRYRSHLG